jgi:hypothetical protein
MRAFATLLGKVEFDAKGDPRSPGFVVYQWITRIDKAIALVAPYAKRVCVRGDTDFSLTAHFDRWAGQVDFVLGTDNIAALRTRADALDASAWQRLQRPAPYQNKTGTTRARRHNRKQEVVEQRGYLNLRLNHEDVAEFTYRPGKCQRDYRVVVVRKNISRIKGDIAPREAGFHLGDFSGLDLQIVREACDLFGGQRARICLRKA